MIADERRTVMARAETLSPLCATGFRSSGKFFSGIQPAPGRVVGADRALQHDDVFIGNLDTLVSGVPSHCTDGARIHTTDSIHLRGAVTTRPFTLELESLN